jgi:transposase
MEHVGLDLHKNESQICVLTEDGEVVERRIRTDRTRLAEFFGCRPRARIVLEASTESEWVARCLEEWGHDVIVADPNFAPMYATRSRRVKTDRRDARALAEACRLGAYRPAHRTSDEQRHVRAQLAVREALVRSRTRYISLCRALLRRDGWRVRTGVVERFPERVAELDLPDELVGELHPLLTMIASLSEQVRLLDKKLEELVKTDEVVARMSTMQGVGPVTAACFVAVVDDARRFRGAHQVEAYVGLTPREFSSGEKQRKGAITKSGNHRMRWLLVQSAWALMRSRHPQAQPLRIWATCIANRRGKRIAMVALARRMCGILFAMMRDRTKFDPAKLRAGAPIRKGEAAA